MGISEADWDRSHQPHTFRFCSSPPSPAWSSQLFPEIKELAPPFLGFYEKIPSLCKIFHYKNFRCSPKIIGLSDCLVDLYFRAICTRNIMQFLQSAFHYILIFPSFFCIFLTDQFFFFFLGPILFVTHPFCWIRASRSGSYEWNSVSIKSSGTLIR